MYNLDQIINEMKERGMKVPVLPILISIPNGNDVLKQYYKYFIEARGETFIYRSEYLEVGKWLENSQHKGLFLYGNVGNGKSQIARLVIPAILLNYYHTIVSVYDATELNKKPDEIISKHVLCIDDIGAEANECVIYGQRRQPMAELLDSAEKNGKLILVTSNLNKDELLRKYGERTFDRIISMTERIVFNGNTFRK